MELPDLLKTGASNPLGQHSADNFAHILASMHYIRCISITATPRSGSKHGASGNPGVAPLDRWPDLPNRRSQCHPHSCPESLTISPARGLLIFFRWPGVYNWGCKSYWLWSQGREEDHGYARLLGGLADRSSPDAVGPLVSHAGCDDCSERPRCGFWMRCCRPSTGRIGKRSIGGRKGSLPFILGTWRPPFCTGCTAAFAAVGNWKKPATIASISSGSWKAGTSIIPLSPSSALVSISRSRSCSSKSDVLPWRWV